MIQPAISLLPVAIWRRVAAKPFWQIRVFLIIFAVAGCVIPMGKKVTAAHKFSKQEIAFLDLPDATREEALASLGPPFWEAHDSRVLLYLWETSFEWQVSPPDHIGSLAWTARPSTVRTDPRRWGLFVAYDSRGRVCSYEIRLVGDGTLEEACSRWAKTLAKLR
jgi:hypothetical protein